MIDRIRDARRRHRLGLLYPAAMLTLGAAATHFSVAPDHLEEFPAFGILFLVVGVAQLALVVLIVLLYSWSKPPRRSRRSIGPVSPRTSWVGSQGRPVRRGILLLRY